MKTITLIALEKDCQKRGKKWIAVAEELHNIQQEKKRITLLEKKLTDDLFNLSGGINSYGGDFMFTHINRKGTIDYESIPELRNIDLELYRRKPTIAWSLKKC